MEIDRAIRVKSVLGKLQSYQKKYKQLLDSDVMFYCDWGGAGNRENLSNMNPELADAVRRLVGEHIGIQVAKLEQELKEL